MAQKRIKAVILKNELNNDHVEWINACDRFSYRIEYRVVDLTLNSWLFEIQKQEFDILLAKPGGLTSHFKNLYDERIYILEKGLGYKIFPSAEEIFIYENKRFLSFWLEANLIPHPKTFVYYHKHEAIEFLKNCLFPIVAKVNIGASGSGVIILKNLEDSFVYLTNTFEGKGVIQRSGPNLRTGNLLKRGMHYVFHPREILSKLKIYQTRKNNLQKGFVIFQEYIPHNFEWRVVRIGNSFFAHKKLKLGEKASGSLLKNYDNPPLKLLDFVNDITHKHKLFSQAVDLFETAEGHYLVNEMQCIFGQSDGFQMMVDGVRGRYVKLKEEWIFESGDFAKNACFDLRLEFVLEELSI